MRGELLIRPARRSDRSAILGTIRAAFAGEGHDEAEEIDVVERIWALRAVAGGLDLVAVRDEDVIGHVIASWGDLAGERVAGIAPLAVRPDHQRSGVGSALMREVIRRGELVGLHLLVLLGAPDYYGRFGFVPAEPFGAWYRPAGHDSPHFMLRTLPAFSECPRGEYRYAWEL